jgi:hypothetical protein
MCIDAKRAIADGQSPAIESSDKNAAWWKPRARRVRREMADRSANGRQHASHAPLDLQTRTAAQVAHKAADRNHRG